MNKIIACCDCEYQEVCHNFDAFFGCKDGKLRLLNEWPLCNEREDSSLLVGDFVEKVLGDNEQ